MADNLATVYGGREGSGEAQIFRPTDSGLGSGLQKIQADRDRDRRILADQLAQDVKSKWDVDNVKYFSPKKDALRQEGVDLYKKSRFGRVDQVEMAKHRQKWQQLQQEADASNFQAVEWQKQKANIEADVKSGKNELDTQASLKNLEILANPEKHVPDEVKAAGGVIPWRAQNMGKYGLVQAYDISKDQAELFKGLKPSDESVSVKSVNGDYDAVTIKKAIPQKEIQARVVAGMNRGGEKGTRYTAHIMQQGADALVRSGVAQPGQDGLLYDKQGNVLDNQQILAAGIDEETVSAHSRTSESAMTVRDKQKSTTTPTEKRKNNFSYTPSTIDDTNPLYKTLQPVKESGAAGWLQRRPTKESYPFVSVQYNKSEPDNKPLQVPISEGETIQTKLIAPVGFIKKGNDWVFLGDEQMKAVGKTGDERSKEKVDQNKPVQVNLSKEKAAAGRIANFLGFASVEDMTNHLNEQTGTKTSKFKGVPAGGF